MTQEAYQFACYPRKSRYLLTVLVTGIILVVSLLIPMNVWAAVKANFQLTDHSPVAYVFWIIYGLFCAFLLFGLVSSILQLIDKRPVIAGVGNDLMVPHGVNSRKNVPINEIVSIKYQALPPEMTRQSRFKDQLLINTKEVTYRVSPFLIEEPTEYLLQEVSRFTGLEIQR